MGVKPAAEGPAISRDDPGQAKLAREGPLQNLTTRGRAAPHADTRRSGARARMALGYPTSAIAYNPTTLQPYNPRYRAQTLTPWPHQTHSPHVSWARATLPTPLHSISVKERDGDPDTDLPFRGTSLSNEPDTRWTKGCSPTHGTHRPANEHENITPTPKCRVMRDPPTSEYIILQKVTSKGRG